jgi:hypothetical protein
LQQLNSNLQHTFMQVCESALLAAAGALLSQGRLKLIDFGSAKALFLPPTVRVSGNHR